MGTFKFELGDMVTTKAELEVERQAYPFKKHPLFIAPGQVLGRFFFESKTGIEEYYHVAKCGQLHRYSIEELVPASELFVLWAELLGEANTAKEMR